ncbi:MAG: hypothetical protein AB7G80_05855 [Dongiaceae bacterium]
MSLKIGQPAPLSIYKKPEVKNEATPLKVFNDLTKPKNPAEYLQPSPQTQVVKQLAESPVYGEAQKILAEANGLAQQASDPNLSDEERSILNTQYQDLQSQLTSLGIGTNPTGSDAAKLENLDLGLAGTDLTSVANAQAAATANDAAFGTLLQQNSSVRAEGYRLENQDREASTQAFFADQALGNPDQEQLDNLLAQKYTAAVQSYSIRQGREEQKSILNLIR